MGVGKVASQVAHACVGLFQRMQKRDAALLERWNRNHCPKICLKVNSLQELDEVEDKASESGILTMAICDAGRTQIEAGSKTCVALCATKERIDLVTGHLKLL
jgi:PTH2 family peptidyl-tRNA hydrolase